MAASMVPLAAVNGAGTDAATTEKTLLTYTIPADTIDGSTKYIHLRIIGSGDGNTSGTLRVKVNGALALTLDGSPLAIAITPALKIWMLDIMVINSNTDELSLLMQTLLGPGWPTGQSTVRLDLAGTAEAVQIDEDIVITLTGQNDQANANGLRCAIAFSELLTTA